MSNRQCIVQTACVSPLFFPYGLLHKIASCTSCSWLFIFVYVQIKQCLDAFKLQATVFFSPFRWCYLIFPVLMTPDLNLLLGKQTLNVLISQLLKKMQIRIHPQMSNYSFNKDTGEHLGT